MVAPSRFQYGSYLAWNGPSGCKASSFIFISLPCKGIKLQEMSSPSNPSFNHSHTPCTSGTRPSFDDHSIGGPAAFPLTVTFSPGPPPTMVSSSAPASPMGARQLEHPQVNINTPGGHIFPLLGPQYTAYSPCASSLTLATGAVWREVSLDLGRSPKRSPTSKSSSPRRKAFKSSISGGNFVTGLKRALSTSVLHNGGGGQKMKLLHGSSTTIEPKAMASTSQLNWLHQNNSLAWDESECACIDTEDERSIIGTRDSSPCGMNQSSLDQGDPKSTPNKKVARSPAPAFPSPLSWADRRETTVKPTKRKVSQSNVTAISWLWGRGMEKDKEEGNLRTRGKSLDLKRNKKRDGMVLSSGEEVEDVVTPQLRQGSGLKVSENGRLAGRRTSLPETDHETQKAIFWIEREKVVPWERMGEGDYSWHITISANEKLTSHLLNPNNRKSRGKGDG